jgi:hypothetical protein
VREQLLHAAHYLTTHKAPYEQIQGLRVAVLRLDVFEQHMRSFFRGKKEPEIKLLELQNGDEK